MAELQSKISLNLKEYLNELQKAVDLTTKAVQQMSGDGVSLGIDTDGLGSVKKEIDALIGSLADQNIVIDADSSGLDEASKKVKKLDSETATPKVKTDDSSVDATKKKIDEIDGSTVKVGVETSGLDKLTEAFSGGLLGGALGGGLAGLAEAGIGAIVGGLGDALNKGLEFNSALGDMKAKTGATKEEMKLLEQASKDAFLGGVGESVAEATNVIANAQVRFGVLWDPKQIAEFTVGAQALGNTFDMDVNDVLTKSEVLVKQYGLTGKEAFDTISLALQNGSSGQDDILDSINEYAPAFKQAGFSALEFTDTLTRGAEAGAFNTDKIGDAVKEAQIRINAGDFETAFDALTESAEKSGVAIDDNVIKAFDDIKNAKGSEKDVAKYVQDIIKQAKDGKISVKQAMQESASEIEKGLDSGKISQSFASSLQVAIAGTPAEDLGVELYGKIFSAPFDEKAIAEKAKKAGTSISGAMGQYTSFEAISRKFELFITTISQGFIAFSDKIIAPIFGGIIEIIGGIKDAFDDTFSGFEGGSGIMDYLDGLIGVFNVLVGLVRDRVSQMFRIAFGIIRGAIEAVGTAISPITDLLTDLYNKVSEGGGFFEDFGTIMKDIGDILGMVGGFIFDLLITPLEMLISISVSVHTAIFNFIAGLLGVGDAGKFFSGILDKIMNGLSNIKGTIGGVIGAFKAFKDAIKNLDFGQVVRDLLSGKNPFESLTSKLSDQYEKDFNKATGKFKNATEEQAGISSALYQQINADITSLASRKDQLSNQEIANEKKKIQTVIDLNAKGNALIKTDAKKLSNELDQITIAVGGGSDNPLGDKPKKQAENFANYMNTDFKDKLKEAFKIEVPKFELKTDFISDTNIQDFIDKVQSGVAPIEALGTAMTGLSIQDKGLEALATYKKQIDELRESYLKITEAPTETPQYLKNIVQGQEDFISKFSKYAGETNAVIDNLNNQKVDLQLKFAETESEEEQKNILKQISEINKKVLDETVKTTKLKGKAKEQGEREYNQFLIDNENNAIELVKETANKQIELLDEKKKKAEQTEKELQSKIAEIHEQGRRRLREIELSELSEDEQAKEKELLALYDKYKQEAIKFQDQKDVLLAITDQYKKDELDIIKKYTKVEKDIFDNLVDSFSDSFSNLDLSSLIDKHGEVIDSIKELEGTYAEQTSELQDQLKNQEISQKDYNEAIVDLEREKNEKLKALEQDKFEFIDALNLGLAESFKNLSDKYTESITAQIAKGGEQSDSLSAYAEDAAVAIGASTISMIASGEKASKAVIVSALKTLTALVPVFTARIFGTQVAELGPAGILVAAGLTAALTALTALASAGGAEDGVIGITKGYKGKRGVTDTIPLWVAEGEGITNKRATNKNKDLLTWMNKTGKHWAEYPALSSTTVGVNGLNYLTPEDIKKPNNPMIINNMGGVASRLDVTNRELKAQSQQLATLTEKFGKIDVKHFYNKQPTVDIKQDITINSKYGRTI